MNKTTFEANGSQLIVSRTFEANIDLVWRAWTDAELLGQWWAYSPWQSKTKRMDFKKEGIRLYAMCGPNGEEHWGLTTYKIINKPTDFSGEDAFCDSEGIVNKGLPVAKFRNEFKAQAESTQVTVISQYASEEHLQQVIQMGMKEGLSMAYQNLDNLLHNLKGQK